MRVKREPATRQVLFLCAEKTTQADGYDFTHRTSFFPEPEGEAAHLFS